VFLIQEEKTSLIPGGYVQIFSNFKTKSNEWWQTQRQKYFNRPRPNYSGISILEFFIRISFLVHSTRMRTTLKLVVIVALIQAVLLSAAVTALVSLIPSAQAQKTFNCSGGFNVNPHGNIRCDPHDIGGGAPPLPSCGHKNSFKNSNACRQW
jgi:hypothetical protein